MVNLRLVVSRWLTNRADSFLGAFIWCHQHIDEYGGPSYAGQRLLYSQAMYEHKALRSDGVCGLTNNRSIHGV